jgi:hypothetical protein
MGPYSVNAVKTVHYPRRGISKQTLSTRTAQDVASAHGKFVRQDCPKVRSAGEASELNIVNSEEDVPFLTDDL